MALSRKELKKIKSQMASQNPSALAAAKSAAKKSKDTIVKKTFIKEDFEPKKSIVRWSFKVNQLVTISHTEQIGIIVSDYKYFTKKVEKNCFFVLIGNQVKQLDGKYLRLLQL